MAIKKLSKEIDFLGRFSDTSLEQIAKDVKELIETYGPKATLEVDCSYSYFDMSIHYQREETPAEILQREEREQLQSLRIEKQELQTLKELKAKYE